MFKFLDRSRYSRIECTVCFLTIKMRSTHFLLADDIQHFTLILNT